MAANRYYNPPDQVRSIGRPLRPGTHSQLVAQLRPGEVLVAVFTNQAPALVAAEVPSQQRLDELEQTWHPTEFYAVPGQQAAADFGP